MNEIVLHKRRVVHGASGAYSFISCNCLLIGFNVGAIYSVISFMACVAPKAKFLVFGIIPVPAWGCVTGLFAYDFFNAVTEQVSQLSTKIYESLPFNLSSKLASAKSVISPEYYLASHTLFVNLVDSQHFRSLLHYRLTAKQREAARAVYMMGISQGLRCFGGVEILWSKRSISFESFSMPESPRLLPTRSTAPRAWFFSKKYVRRFFLSSGKGSRSANR